MLYLEVFKVWQEVLSNCREPDCHRFRGRRNLIRIMQIIPGISELITKTERTIGTQIGTKRLDDLLM